uniref:Uncharacterized protein n=1 Tax=Nelumbo nucifera TaxID=4432 RepID=A0A822YEA2_NELNU|nr:TPA_asm: hypothetical protein HUJ06_011355 [Nelumbo nucifera]
MASFRLALETCGLTNLGYWEPGFTWSNNRQGDQNVVGRLDRAVYNLIWNSLFPKAKVFHEAAMELNHCTIILTL